MNSQEILPQDPVEAIRKLAEMDPGQVVFTTSLGKEDQAITHMLAEANLPVRIVTLDTGRLFPQTYELMERTSKRYGVEIQVYSPDALEVEAYVNASGINGFYNSIEARKQCCAVRKMGPLNRAIAGMSVWITGLRAAQSPSRSTLSQLEQTPEGMLKYHPLLDWTDDQLEAYLNLHAIPVNPLHKKGVVSIGCAPCTQAVSPGDHPRSGRWAWEQSAKECGLHAR